MDNYDGFIFEDEEKIGEEREERDAEADKIFTSNEEGVISFNLPSAYGPSDLGKTLILLTYLYEGVRIALTAPYGSFEDFQNRVFRPELYGAYKDKHALRLTSIASGSVKGILKGACEVTEIIKTIRDWTKDVLLKDIEVIKEAQKLKHEEEKEKIETSKQKIEVLCMPIKFCGKARTISYSLS